MEKKYKQFDRGSIILLILGIGIGVLLTAQWKTPYNRAVNPVSPYIALKETREDLTQEQNNLKTSIINIQKYISEKEADLKKFNNNKEKIETIEDYQKKLGLTEIKGEGIIITLDDAENEETTAESIAHAADLRDTINFLWSLNVDGISINNERVVVTSSVDCIVNTILINSTKTIPPFKISAVGDANKIIKQFESADNLKDIKKRVKSQGLVFQIEKNNSLTLPAFGGSFVIEHAKIVK